MLKRLSKTEWVDLEARLVEAYRAVEREPVPDSFLQMIDRLSSEPAADDES